MTKLAIYPFFSQQNKATNKFILDTCASAKQTAWLAEAVQQYLGWDACAAIPAGCTSYPYKCETREVLLPPVNPLQQIHWDAFALAKFFRGADVALCNHELIAIPLRRMYPRMRIITMCLVRPEPLSLFQLAWESSDLVVAQGNYMAKRIAMLTKKPVVPWELCYDKEKFTRDVNTVRPIDVLFVNRSSASNYTHHLEFMEAMRNSALRVAYVDPTSYLRLTGVNVEIFPPTSYMDALYSSKVAVAFNDSWYGGLSIREAVAAGCCPALLRLPCFEDMVGITWPYFAETLDPLHILQAVEAAVASPIQLLCDFSYQAAWPGIMHDLQELVQ